MALGSTWGWAHASFGHLLAISQDFNGRLQSELVDEVGQSAAALGTEL